MPKILVADDNANIQKMVVLAFEERGIQVVTVGNGEAAVRRIPDLEPDLILADIFMPVRNGYEVCEFVKKDKRFSHVPVILLVGAFDPLDEKEARRVGADGVLKKPFVPPDPLIAMVMSALEKNPKVVAEMAKAKEAKEVLPPEPAPRLELPSRAEPKPLPDFPEPTAEEAAIVYGFGKGVRALDDEQLGVATGSKAPVAEAEEEDEETDEDKFDGASTSSDWRRNAMDFEVPAESANKPAFTDEDFDPVTFPSEGEYPPRRVRVPEAEEETAPVVRVAPAAEHEALAFVETGAAAPAIVEAPAAQALPATEIFEPSAKSVEAVEMASNPEPEIQEAPAPESKSISEPAPKPISEIKSDAASESTSPSNTPHWMDALAPFQTRQTVGGWISALSEQPSEAIVAARQAEEPANSLAPSPATIASVEAHAEAVTEAIVEESEASALIPSVNHDEPPPADEPPTSAPEESWFAPAPPVFERIYDPVSAPVAIAPSAPDRSLELDHSDGEPSLAFKDPGLVESPAVRVIPEPLLVDDNEPQGPSGYGVRAQEVSPLHSFFAPASGDPVVEDSVEDVSARDEAPVPSFDPLPIEINQADERIPTAPPPNLEALAEIPFLVPPADFRAEIQEAATNPDSVDVDAVVRRVLEKLEPQLHEMLSQGVLKPLVENLLQSELAKKGK